MNEKVIRTLQGFYKLTAKEKLQLVEAINEYFDATEREPVRARHEAEYERLSSNAENGICPCCGR